MAINHVTNEILARGEITDSDLLALRRAFYGDGLISQDEATTLFEINDRAKISAEGWKWFFIEAMSDFLVFQMEPEGYVDEANAQWLIKHIEADGVVTTATELELLIHVMEHAESVPESLSQFALTQVKNTILKGHGATRNGEALEPGRVVAADIDMLRRILYAYGGGGNIGITKAEAEVLFDINDATAGAANDPAWNVFFAQAVANYLMAANGHFPLTREQALHIENWLDEKETNFPDLMGKMAAQLRAFSAPKAAGYNLAAAVRDSAENQARQRRLAREREAIQAERITAGEANWFVERINRDGMISDAERAALLFVKQESPSIDPVLQPLLDKVA
jgi:predicted lipid carrier protein YhbT